MSASDALARGTGLVDLPREASFVVAGADARAFLHRMTTQDLRATAVGDARPACFLSAQGRVLASLLVEDAGDGFRLALDARAAATAIPALERYVIADDVTFSDVTPSLACALLAGPAAPAALTAAGIAVPANGRFLAAEALGAGASVLRSDLGDRPAFRIAVPAGRFAAARAALLALPGVEAASAGDLDVARIETGTPAWGAEIDERVLPTECGLGAAVSWTKGCYVGQEAVVMAKHRGHPPSLLCRVHLDGDAVPAGGALLLPPAPAATAPARPAGRVTTAGRGVLHPGVVALALVRFDLAKPGTVLVVEGSGARAVVAQVHV